ncbi:hypothetical protein EMEDMD4_170046 [Sinorhizobium medicae]|uniref:Uncharacterized protein n=1 Tax=Sinorhizobium medicae TaxID=110321 RepID=A0A508WXX1_9HYPH|nr:hypothetical protein EMEDMD4_170046 [Sinorhizobium medicae]
MFEDDPSLFSTMKIHKGNCANESESHACTFDGQEGSGLIFLRTKIKSVDRTTLLVPCEYM